jgi:hypothetical protein
MRVICAGPGCFTKEPELPAVRVVPDTVLEETNRLRSSLGRPRTDDVAMAAVLAAGERKIFLPKPTSRVVAVCCGFGSGGRGGGDGGRATRMGGAGKCA